MTRYPLFVDKVEPRWKANCGSYGVVQNALYDLSNTLLTTTNLPNPYTGLTAKSSSSTSTSSNPIPEPTTLSARLLGSKVKQEKELPVYEHLQAVKDVVLDLISSTASNEGKDVLPTPKPKYRWALHQRTTVPWPMPPRPAARGEKQPTPVIPTDRVHLDCYPEPSLSTTFLRR